jgi:hypothetical protein
LIAVLGSAPLSAAQKAISSPDLVNNIVWKNRSFFYSVVNGASTLCASNNATATGCTQLPDQATTGQCVTGAAYWDLGVLGDIDSAHAVPSTVLNISAASQSGGNGNSATSQKTVTVTTSAPHGLPNGTAGVRISGVTGTAAATYNGTFTVTRVNNTRFSYQPNNNLTTNNSFGNGRNATVNFTTATATMPSLALSPTYSVLTDITGYTGTGNKSADPNLADFYCNGSRVTPEFPAVINPPSVKNLQVSATVDEGNNYVNLRYGPLYLSKPADSTGGAYIPFGDYHIQLGSPAINAGATVLGVTRDFDGNPRPIGPAYDIGADEKQ